VSASRFETNFQERTAFVIQGDSITQDGMFRIGMLLINDFGACHIGDFPHMIAPDTLLRCDVTFDQCPVALFDGAILELIADPPSRPHVSRHHQDARRGSIQTVGEPQVEITRRLLTFVEKRLHPRLQTVDAWWSLSQQSARFRHGEAWPVFVQ
jgi:hypothetical protein